MARLASTILLNSSGRQKRRAGGGHKVEGGQEATATNRDEAAMSIVKKKLSASSGISCHAWNGDRSKVALCPYNNEVHVYEVGNNGEYELTGKLEEHEQLVAGVDWSPTRDMIVTCAHDRNAYVWEKGTEGKVRRARRDKPPFSRTRIAEER